jgi:tellurite resistance protein TehA-like permease
MHGRYLEAERLRGELGVFALKVVMTVNAGALLAILAMIANMDRVRNHQPYEAALAVSGWYLAGLVAAMLAGLLGYFYQGALAHNRRDEYYEAIGRPKDNSCLSKNEKLLYRGTLACGIGAFVAFSLGSLSFLTRVSL